MALDTTCEELWPQHSRAVSPDDAVHSTTSQTADSAILASELRASVRSAIDALPSTERDVITARFGLFGDDDKTLEDVAVGRGVTRERIRQIEGRALRRLFRSSRGRVLRDFLGDAT